MDMIENIKNFIRNEVRSMHTENIINEMTVTSDIQGYDTPLAFTAGKGKKKKKQISTNSTGYKIVKEEVDGKDIKLVKLIIRDEVADILKNIWLKRSAWK